MPSVKYSDLEMAMEFVSVSGGSLLDAGAYISRESGKIYWDSDAGDPEEELPEDIDKSDLYAEVPGKRDLNLGRPLVLEFAGRFVPDLYDEIAQIFRSKGAYARCKDLLYEKGKLEQWYEFEQSAIEKALVSWAETEGFVVEKDSGT